MSLLQQIYSIDDIRVSISGVDTPKNRNTILDEPELLGPSPKVSNDLNNWQNRCKRGPKSKKDGWDRSTKEKVAFEKQLNEYLTRFWKTEKLGSRAPRNKSEYDNKNKFEELSHYADYDTWTLEPVLYSCFGKTGSKCKGKKKTKRGYLLKCWYCDSKGGAQN